MRQLTPLSNVLLALAAAVALAASLRLPWYAPPEATGAGAEEEIWAIEGVFAAIGRWFTSDGPPVAGQQALVAGELALLAAAGATAVLALLMLVSALRGAVRDLFRLLPLAAPVIVFVQIVNPPGDMELRWGVFVALAVALFMANSAVHGSELRDPKPAPKPYSPPPAPGSLAPPQG